MTKARGVESRRRQQTAKVVARLKACREDPELLRHSYRRRDNVWEGVLRDRKTNLVIWECGHRHKNRDNPVMQNGHKVQDSALTCAFQELRRRTEAKAVTEDNFTFERLPNYGDTWERYRVLRPAKFGNLQVVGIVANTQRRGWTHSGTAGYFDTKEQAAEHLAQVDAP